MPRWMLFSILVGGACLAGGFVFRQMSRDRDAGPAAPPVAPPIPASEPASKTEAKDAFPKLPETEPPAGLPIVRWGKRDHFEIIRKPEFFTPEEADKALAPDEPVLGIVLGSEARAYS